MPAAQFPSCSPPERRNRMRAVAGLLLFATALIWAADYGYSRGVNEKLLANMAARFGADARPRLGTWVDFGRNETLPGQPAEPGPANERLQRINSFLNRVPFREDIVHWRVEDYWATPAETIASNGGDCEDYAIAKYFLLKELGVPLARLRMVYVRAGKSAQAHMVLAYYARPDAEPLILDNLDDRVRTASSRTDLVPVYSFNEEDVVLTSTGQKTTPQQIRAWRAVLDRLQREAVL